MNPFDIVYNKGGEQVAKVGGTQTFDSVRWQQLGCGHMPTAHLGGSGGMLPQKIFGNFDSLRVFLMHSGSSFGSELASDNFY